MNAALIIKYWPAVVAAIYLAYVVASKQTALIPAALSAFLAAVGLNHSAVTAHAELARLRRPDVHG